MSTPNYDINYNDKRFTEVEADKKAALNEVDVTYGKMIGQSDQYFDKQIQAAQDYANKQTKLQNQQTEFAIDQIEQQKAQAKQDYTKEQSGAYVDWQKQSNQYGANAEQMAAQGMMNTGYSESSQVSMFNTYQNRVATAREAYNRAVLNYDNAIKDARLQNNAALAEIAYNALQTQLELSLEGFQYKNQLLLAKADAKTDVENNYYTRYQDVLKQINTENSLAEEVRQYNESLAMEQKKLAEEQRQYNQTLALQKAQLAEEQRQFNATHAGNSAKIDKSSGGGGSGKRSSSHSSNVQKNRAKKMENVIKSKVDNTVAKEKSSSNNIDMNSVLALGYGPISASKLNSLVKSGVVEEYKSGGKTKFRKSAYTNKQASLFKHMG